MLLGRGGEHGVLYSVGGDVNGWVQREGQQRGEPALKTAVVKFPRDPSSPLLAFDLEKIMI